MATQDIKSGLLTSTTSEPAGTYSSSDGRSPLALSNTAYSTVSDFAGFGTYSGSDIKMIVHYPKARAIELAVQRRRQEINTELNEQNNLLAESTDPNQVNIIEAIINSLNSELETLTEESLNVKNLPTSKVLAEVQTVSWSTYREKSPVRSLGSVYPKAFVRGPLSIGGSMIFTLFNKHVFNELLELNLGAYNTGTSDFDNYKSTTSLIHQLPPLDFSFIFANEYGSVSHMGLWGVEFLQEGGTFSIEDIYSESVIQYVARDIDPIRLAGRRKISDQGVTNMWTETASDLMLKEQNNFAYRDHQDPFK